MARRHPRRARHAAAPTSRVRHSLRHRSLQCERLEDRRLLAVVTVDTNLDVVDFNDGKTSLREAVFAANTVPGADEIRFDFGHDGPETILLTQGELAISDALSIVGPGAGLLTIDGQLGSRLFNVSVAAGNVGFQGMTLTRGQTSGDNSTAGDLLNQTFSGGAVRSVTAGVVTLDAVDVVSNGTTGVNAAGGALYVTGPLVIKQSKIRGNVASGAGAEGGGLAASGVVTIVATTFFGNRGARGGGVSSSGELTIDSSTFNGNKAVDTVAALGGAVYATGKLSVVNSTISTNAAQSTGTNSRAQGAGVWTNGDASLAHSTIAANTASTVGTGAIAAGGGLYADQSAAETLAIKHTIIGGNLTTEVQGELRLGAGVLVMSYSLIADNDGTTLAEAPIGWADAQGNLIGGARYGYIEPLLDGLEDNGGSTRTHALLPGSPAVFAGDMALTPGAGGTPEFDQRGAPYARRVGTRMAIGAVESAIVPIIVDSLADGSDGNYGPGELTLREALELANGRPGFDAVEFAPSLFAEGPQEIALRNGELRISEELNLYGPGAALLTIDASGNDRYPDRLGGGTSVVLIDDANSRHAFKSTIVGVSLTGAERGAIKSQESLILVGVDIHDNRTSSQGDTAGGVATFELHLIASRVFRNDALRGTGAISSSGQLVIERSEVTGNGSLTPTVGAFVGAISVRRSWSAYPRTTYSVTIVDSDISGNQGSEVGGIASNEFGFYMINTNLSDNYGHRTGGANIQAIGSEFGIWGSTIKGNSSRFNLAGIELSGYQQGIIDQTTISGNYRAGASGNGGGGVLATGSRLEVRGSTVTGNDRTGISVSGSRTVIGHSIIAGNGRLGGGDLVHRATAPTVEYSLIGNNAGSELSESPVGRPDENGNLIGSSLRGVIDPLLAPLADNGGPLLPGGARLLTHALLPGSPAIDGGDATLAAGEGETPEFDQRGAPYARVLGARIDMGAIEQGGTPFIADTLEDEFDGDYSRGDLSLREAVWLANRQPGADVIQFHRGGILPLELGEIVISEALAIEALAPTPVSIIASGNRPIVVDENGSIQTDRAFRIDDGDAAIESAVVLRRINVSGAVGLREGGAIWSAEPLTVANGMFYGNFALSGGAIWAGDELTVEGCTFENNNSSDEGGAIHASADATIRGSTFASNRSAVGGAVHARSESPLRASLLQLENNDFNRNSATLGGAVAWDEWTTVVVVGSIFTFNRVTQSETSTPKGGALYGAGPVVIAHSTLSENRIGFTSSVEPIAAAIEVKMAYVTHSIIAFNGFIGFDQQRDIVVMSGGHFSADYSILGDGSPLPWTGPETTDARHNRVGNYINRDRVFFAGFFPGDDAIDAGNPGLTAANSPLAEFDLRGAPMRRFFGGRIDIGAYETQTAEGDFDGNGIVDGADFLRWQRGAGEFIGGHASGDGFIGGDDRELWQRRFGDESDVPAPGLAAVLAEEESADAWMATVVDELPKVGSDFSGLAGVTLKRANVGVSSRAERGGLELLKGRASRVAPTHDQEFSAVQVHTDRVQKRGIASWPQRTDWLVMEESLTAGAIDEAFALVDVLEREIG